MLVMILFLSQTTIATNFNSAWCKRVLQMKLFFWCKKVQLLKRDREKDVYAPGGMRWGAGTVVKVILWAYKK